MSSFLAELAGEATQKLEAMRVQQQDRQAMMQSVHGALDRTFQFFHLFNTHVNALAPDVPRVYALDGRTQFSGLKWKSGMVDYRKQSLADNALLDHVYFQVRMTVAEPVTVARRWDQFDELKREIQAFGLKPLEDLDALWKSRPQKDVFQVRLAPEVLLRMRFQGNYGDGSIDLMCNNVDGFGAMKSNIRPEFLQPAMFDEIGRFLVGRTGMLPPDLKLKRDLSPSL